MPTDGKKDYQVGYARPPKRARFKKGHSGNPKGRPRGSRNTATLLAKALEERVVVVENGRRKTITKREAFCKQLVNRGLKEPRSAKLLLDEMRLLGDTEGGESEIKQRGGVEVPLPPPLTAKQRRAEAIATLKIMYETGIIEANLRAASEEINRHHHGRRRVRGVGVDSTDGKRYHPEGIGNRPQMVPARSQVAALVQPEVAFVACTKCRKQIVGAAVELNGGRYHAACTVGL